MREKASGIGDFVYISLLAERYLCMGDHVFLIGGLSYS